MIQPWMIRDLERQREQRDRENELARSLWLPLPLPPPNREPDKEVNDQWSLSL